MYGIGGTSAAGGLETDPPAKGGAGWAAGLDNTHDKLNERAVAVVQRIQTKLTGRDFSDSAGVLSVSEQVLFLLTTHARFE